MNILLALVLLLAFVPWISAEEADDQPLSGPVYEHQTCQDQSLNIKQMISEILVAKCTDVSTDTANAIARADLQQQQSMADSTKSLEADSRKQEAYSYWSLWLNGGGLLILFAALAYNIKATYAATAAANAATRQTEMARAWVAILQPEIEKSRAELIIRVPIANYGETPAFDVKVNISFLGIDTSESSLNEVEETCGYIVKGPTTELHFRFKEQAAEEIGIECECTIELSYQTIHGKNEDVRGATSGKYMVKRERTQFIPGETTYGKGFEVQLIPSSAVMM